MVVVVVGRAMECVGEELRKDKKMLNGRGGGKIAWWWLSGGGAQAESQWWVVGIQSGLFNSGWEI